MSLSPSQSGFDAHLVKPASIQAVMELLQGAASRDGDSAGFA